MGKPLLENWRWIVGLGALIAYVLVLVAAFAAPPAPSAGACNLTNLF